MNQQYRKSVAAFIAACAYGVVTEGAIRGIRFSLNRTGRSSSKSALTDAEAVAVHEAIEAHTPRVTQAQFDKGRRYLLSASLKKNGQLRKNSPLTRDQVETVHMAECARLVEMADVGTHYSRHFPVYSYRAQGRQFTYMAASWQSGMQTIQPEWR